MADTDPAVTAAAEALCTPYPPCTHERDEIWCARCDAEAVVAAARPIIEAEVRERIAAEIGEYAAPLRKQYERWLFTYGSSVEPGSRDPELEGALTALFHAARIARGEKP